MAMKFYDNAAAEQPLIEEMIGKFGYAPEHNFNWWRFCTEEDEKGVFAAGADGGGLLTMRGKDESRVFSSPVMPLIGRAPILVEYLDRIFQEPDIKKVWFELETPLRKEFLRILPDRFVARPINYTLTWPIMNIKAFDPTLPGGHYKFLRKEKHRFYRNHAVRIADAKNFEDRKSLFAIIDRWKKQRKAHDRAWSTEYVNMIKGGFEGMATARVFIVDEKPVGINAGWLIPNSDRFYGAVGIHDYSLPNLGAMLYLEDLEFLKDAGYREADMGGGEKALTAFKKEFLPESFYKTHIFSVAKK
jgi:hypothetical protein